MLHFIFNLSRPGSMIAIKSIMDKKLPLGISDRFGQSTRIYQF